MNWACKVIRGDSYRRTRFHDEKGHCVTFEALSNLPRALITWGLFKTAGYRPKLPWLSYDAIRIIEKILDPGKRVLEFGSGMSTLWLAERCGFLVSIEHDRKWYKTVAKQLSRHDFSNVAYQLRSWEDYENLNGESDLKFDFVLVDGVKRLQCVRTALGKLASGGFIYLDDSDVHRDPERQLAEELILAAVDRTGGSVSYFVDFAPALIHTKEGLLARLG